jgi:hypothetical protein
VSARVDEQAVAFEAFGLKIGVTADDPNVIARLQGLGPAGSRPCDPQDVECRIGVTTTALGRFNVRFDVREGEVLAERDPTVYIAGDSDLDLAIESLDVHVQSYIALHAPDHIFIRAGVVAYRGHAILLPGGPVSGTSTLVHELVRTGATAYSEDYAPLDREGRVHAYFRPSVPGVEQGTQPQRPAGEACLESPEPLPVSAVVLTTYMPGAEWQPRYLSRGEAILSLMSHAEPGSERPEETFEVITRSLTDSLVTIQSERGEVAAVAPLLLSDVERALAEAA